MRGSISLKNGRFGPENGLKFSRNWAQPCNNKSGEDGETRLIKEIFGLLKIQRGKKFQIYAQPALQLLSTISMQLHNISGLVLKMN